MAVVLIRLKMRSLLPRPQTEDLETGALVSMDEIVAEFQRYREAANVLAQKEEERRRLFPRAGAAPGIFAESGDVMLLTETLRTILSGPKRRTIGCRASPAQDLRTLCRLCAAS